MNIEQFILDSLQNIGSTNFDLVIKFVLLLFVIFWVVVIVWTWFDSSERSTKLFFRITSVLVVAIFNIPGLIMYILLRPKATIEEIYWADLERRYLKFETAELGDCPKCGCQLLPGFLVCPSCNFELRKKCPSCNSYNDKSWKYCPYCTVKVATQVEEVKPTTQAEHVEIMQAAVAETKQEIETAVNENKVRYVFKNGVLVNISAFFEKIFTKIKSLKPVKKAKADKAPVKEVIDAKTPVKKENKNQNKKKSKHKK
jgi:hypothetical protein